MLTYSLWDIRTASIIGAFDSEREAFALVLSGIERNGPDDTDTLTLAIEHQNGRSRIIAQGKALAERARRELAGQRLAG